MQYQYVVTVALNYEQIKWNLERVSNIKPFINKYKWKGINYPWKIDDWKTFENLKIALNILYIKEKEICSADISEINSNCEKQIILFNDSKQRKRRLELSCSEKTICIFAWYNFKI